MITIKLLFCVTVGIFAIITQTRAINLSANAACDYCKNLVMSTENADNSLETISNELGDQFYRKVKNSNLSPYEFCTNIENLCDADEDMETFGTPDECRKCQKIANNLISHIAYGRQSVVEHAGEFGCAKFKMFQKLSCKLWLVKHKNALIDAILETHNNPHHACIIMRQC